MQLGPFAEVRLAFTGGDGWARSSRNPKQSKCLQQRVVDPAASMGSLRLKHVGAEDPVPFDFNVIVGNVTVGPFQCRFTESSAEDFPLGIDWREHLEPRTGCLRLRVQALLA
eukprot:CAMPEP_0198561100 /NCGR_PEP_ID=MMETSP1462-20131121/94896_1 /TAXON_ID=1333877 /ORGANISM="Brandtodinium nutriculum, Strain RCC3387" /LENGTH=111 /DNA_ID=CAMNT_0044291989 /DNA_START=57 /DNA_END=392 /DNA_ORIENTATION=+